MSSVRGVYAHESGIPAEPRPLRPLRELPQGSSELDGRGIVEPHDLSSRLRHAEPPPRHEPAAPLAAATHAPAPAPAPAIHPELADSDWRSLHSVVRSILVAEETQRLYPEGHQQVRRAVKEALSKVQEHFQEKGRAFTFIPELAIDIRETERGQAAKDIEELALICRLRRIRRIAIHPEVDCEELHDLVRCLRKAEPVDGEPEFQPQGGWRRIEVHYSREGEDEDRYRFSQEGNQLFAAPAGGRRPSQHVIEGLPSSFRKSLEAVFCDPAVGDAIGRLEKRLGLEPGGAESGKGAHRADIDLIDEIIKSVFHDPGSYVDVAPEEIFRRITEFLNFLEGIAPSLPPHDDITGQMRAEEVRNLIRGAVGVRDWSQPSLAETFQQSARVKALFDAPAALQRNRSFRMTSPVSEADRGLLQPAPAPAPAREPPPRNAAPQPHGDPAPRPEQHAPAPPPEPAPLQLAPIEASQLASEPSLEGLEALLSAYVSKEAVSAHIQSFDYDLEAIRVQSELLLWDCPPEVFLVRRENYLNALNGREWKDVDVYVEELNATSSLLGRRNERLEVDLIADALATQPSQDAINRFFFVRARGGTPVAKLRPVLEHLGRKAPERPITVLTHLWKTTPRKDRDLFLDEIFQLDPSPDGLASWATKNPQAFSAPRTLIHLKKLPIGTLEALFKRLFASDKEARRSPPAALSLVLRSVAKKPEGERLILLALQHCGPRMRLEALSMLEGCESKELFNLLAGLVEFQNAEEQPALEEVRLALTALVRSKLPHAKNFLRRVRNEKKLLLHTFRREIREVLDLLTKVETLG